MGMEQGDRNGRTTVKDHEAAPQTSSRGKLVKAGATSYQPMVIRLDGAKQEWGWSRATETAGQQ